MSVKSFSLLYENAFYGLCAERKRTFQCEYEILWIFYGCNLLDILGKREKISLISNEGNWWGIRWIFGENSKIMESKVTQEAYCKNSLKIPSLCWPFMLSIFRSSIAFKKFNFQVQSTNSLPTFLHERFTNQANNKKQYELWEHLQPFHIKIIFLTEIHNEPLAILRYKFLKSLHCCCGRKKELKHALNLRIKDVKYFFLWRNSNFQPPRIWNYWWKNRG